MYRMCAFVLRHQRGILYAAIAEVVVLIVLDLLGIASPTARLLLYGL